MASRFNKIKVNLTGGSKSSRSSALNSEKTVNFYPEHSEGSKEQYVLQSFPGQKLFKDLAPGADRGLTVMKEVLYWVKNNEVLKIESDGSETFIGSVGFGSNPCSFANDGEKLVIVSNGNVFIYDSFLNTFEPATSSALTETEILSVNIVNNQFHYVDFRFQYFSDVGQPDIINGLNIIGAESNPDDIVGAEIYDQLIYVFGKRTVEFWQNTGRGKPPIERLEGRILNVGLSSRDSVAFNDNAVYFLGDDKKVYQTKGGQHQTISTTSISNQLESFDKINDARGFTFSFEGYNFYGLTFTEEQRTFCYNENLGKEGWFELNSGDFDESGILENTYNVASMVQVYNKTVMADLKNGNLYELDINTFKNNDKQILRERITASINGNLINEPGELIQMSKLELIVETGVGNVFGEGEDPIIIIEPSYDGGKSFKKGSFVKIGRLGETSIRAEWFNLSKFTDMILRIRTSDPVQYSIHSAVIHIRKAGR